MYEVKLFISAVTNEFAEDPGDEKFLRGIKASDLPGDYRVGLSEDLNCLGVLVQKQEGFAAGGVPTLDKVLPYIQWSDVVIHLVGDMTGAVASDEAVASLFKTMPHLAEKLPFLKDLESAQRMRLPYTQWEAYLAIYFGKPLVICVPEAQAPRASRAVRDEEQSRLQSEHIARLKALKCYPEIWFANRDRLTIAVFRMIGTLRAAISERKAELELSLPKAPRPGETDPHRGRAGFEPFTKPFVPIARAIYGPGQIVCDLDPSPVPLPAPFRARLSHLKWSYEVAKAAGETTPWDGPMLGIVRFKVGERTPGDERPILLVTLRKTSWWVMEATNFYHESPEQQKLTREFDPLVEPVNGFANSTLVHITAVTSDNYMVVGYRGEVSSETANFQATFGENMNPESDVVDGVPDYFRCAARGIDEELKGTLVPGKLWFHTFGVDLDRHQHVLLGTAYLQETRAMIQERFDHLLARDASENSRLCFVRFEPQEVAAFLRLNYEKFSLLGFAAAFYALLPPGDIAVFEQVRQLFAEMSA